MQGVEFGGDPCARSGKMLKTFAKVKLIKQVHTQVHTFWLSLNQWSQIVFTVFQVDFEPNGFMFGSKSIGKW